MSDSSWIDDHEYILLAIAFNYTTWYFLRRAHGRVAQRLNTPIIVSFLVGLIALLIFHNIEESHKVEKETHTVHGLHWPASCPTHDHSHPHGVVC